MNHMDLKRREKCELMWVMLWCCFALGMYSTGYPQGQDSECKHCLIEYKQPL